VRSRFPKGLPAAAFAEQAAVIFGDDIHPTAKGTAAPAPIPEQLAEEASHRLNLTRIEGPRWIEASIASHAAADRPMAEVLPRGAETGTGAPLTPPATRFISLPNRRRGLAAACIFNT
jgi:hypothetical protein